MKIYLETSNTGRLGRRSGIPTVVRGLAASLGSHGYDVKPIYWSREEECLAPLKQEWKANLDLSPDQKPRLPLTSFVQPALWPVWFRHAGMNYKTPIHLHPDYGPKLKGRWLVLPELMQGDEVRLVAGYARKHGMKLAGIFYDAIPVLHPGLIFHRTPDAHADYMAALAELDAVIAISETSAKDFADFAKARNLHLPPVLACDLPAQIAGENRVTTPRGKKEGSVKILYVSTLEPRKNHLLLIAAFEEACTKLGTTKMELHLVGRSSEPGPQIAEKVRAATERNPNIFWHEGVGREELRNFYRKCDFTVYASWVEGFGLPIMESLWFGLPCLCANEGVMAENARGGGCLMVNVRDQHALADGLAKLAGDAAHRRELEKELMQRKLKTWNEYADDVLCVLKANQ